MWGGQFNWNDYGVWHSCIKDSVQNSNNSTKYNRYLIKTKGYKNQNIVTITTKINQSIILIIQTFIQKPNWTINNINTILTAILFCQSFFNEELLFTCRLIFIVIITFQQSISNWTIFYLLYSSRLSMSEDILSSSYLVLIS